MTAAPTVLVVDDSLSVRKVVERALEARHFRVLSAALGSEAIERFERDQPDLVVCDVLLPDKDGYHVCDFVKRHPRLGRTPVLLISGIVDAGVLERAAAVGSDQVLGKPFTAEELTRKIGDLLASCRDGAPPHPTGTTDSASDGAPRPIAAATSPGTAGAPGTTPNGTASVAPAIWGTANPTVAAGPPPRVSPGDAADALPPGPGEASRAGGEPAQPTTLDAVRAPAVSRAPDEPGTPELSGTLTALAAIAGVRLALVADREGFVVDAVGPAGATAEAAAALAACLAECADGLGRELGEGPLQGVILEYERGLVLLHAAGPRAMLAVLLGDTTGLGKLRYYVKKALPELVRAL